MKDVHKTLLYIAYNLENHNQIITTDAILQVLVLLKSKDFDLDKEIKCLVVNGFLFRNSEKELSLTETGKDEAFRINKIKAKEEFNGLISRAANSTVYLDFCQEIYGYRMYLFNMMDKQQLDYLFNTIPVSRGDNILDLGCGTGSVLENLVNKYECYGIGIDQLDKATVEKCSKRILYIEGDLDALVGYNLRPTITLSVDSLYFSSDLDGLIKQLKYVSNNRLYLFYSQYIFDEKTKDKTILHCDNTRIAKSLQKNQLQYKVTDYSANEQSLYENALKILPKYKNVLQDEGNSNLYETKLKEYRAGQQLYAKGLAGRYLYIVE